MGGPIHLRARYRPIRIGWCIQVGNLEEYRRALRLTHTMWGGRFNPLIPLDDPELARLLIDAFRVDCLYFLSDSPQGRLFETEFEHLLWPGHEKELFLDGMNRPLAAFLDVYHPAKHFYENNIKGEEDAEWKGVFFRWDTADQLADVFLATFGAYPAKEDIGLDYRALFNELLGYQEFHIVKDADVWPAAVDAFTPSALTTFELQLHARSWGWHEPGLYHGASGDFDDLVNFWNLRASGIDLFFYDPALRPRLSGLTDRHLAKLRAKPKDPRGMLDRIAIWSKSPDPSMDCSAFGPDLELPSCSPTIWGLNLTPSIVGFEERSVLGILSDDNHASATFELPPKPFFDEPAFYMQQVVVSVHPLIRTENVVLQPPFLPRLNEYYGREIHTYNTVRSEPNGVGIITDLTTHSLTIRALDVRTLVNRIFTTFGISAKPSPAGLVGLRLIEQMGGLQGCRVFKIAGVRELIRAYLPDQSFTRSGAIATIGQLDPASGKPRFSDYESLFIEPREGRSLKPQDAFYYLLKRGVFRPGLCLLCPNCELENWVHLDDASTMSGCEYCGKDFNITPQLRDRDWAYRRSGLFGRDDHQGGGIPVALMLQQIQTALQDHLLAYTTGTELEPTLADIQKCETDFVLIVESPREKTLQIAIGECKSDGGEIKADDVRKMSRVADAMTGKGCEVFIIFSKTSMFSPEEVERCKVAQGRNKQRVILFSERELKPYYLYEQTAKEFAISPYASSLEQMAQATQHIYFEPKPRAAAPPPNTPDARPAT